jgi:hypothetical protein
MHAVDGGELVQGIIQAYRGNGRTTDGGEHDPPQRIPDGGRKTTLEWLTDELAVPVGERPLVDLEFFRGNEGMPVFIKGIVIPDFLCHAIPAVKVTWSTARRSAVPG